MSKEICLSLLKKGIITANLLDDVDCNSLVEPQWSFLRNRCMNTPANDDTWWYLEVMSFTSWGIGVYTIQRCISVYTPGNVYVRTQTDGSWKPWVKI